MLCKILLVLSSRLKTLFIIIYNINEREFFLKKKSWILSVIQVKGLPVLTEAHMEAEKVKVTALSDRHFPLFPVIWLLPKSTELILIFALLADTNHINWPFYSDLSSSFVKWLYSFKLNAQLPLGLPALWHLLLLTWRTAWHRQYVARAPAVCPPQPPSGQTASSRNGSAKLWAPPSGRPSAAHCLDLA